MSAKKRKPTSEETLETLVASSRSLFYESVPSFTLLSAHQYWCYNSLMALEDGTFVSCCNDGTAKRWVRDKDTNTIQLLGTYSGHTGSVQLAIEKENNTLITGSQDKTLKVWNTTTCECLSTHPMWSSVWYVEEQKESCLWVVQWNS